MAGDKPLDFEELLREFADLALLERRIRRRALALNTPLFTLSPAPPYFYQEL